jgi:hypothetical protein
MVVTSLVVVVSGATGCTRGEKTDDRASPDASATIAPRIASCDRITSMSVCSEYSAAYLGTNEAVHRAACAKLAGTFALGECPNTSVLGTCTLSTGEARKFYAGGAAAYDAVSAEKACGGYAGTWAR